MTVVAVSFVCCLILFACIGAASLRHKEATTHDYLLAGRSVSGWLTALSSAATNNSGFMFIGLLGFTYRFGLQAIWLQGGWVVGDLIAWLFVHERVRERSHRLEVVSLPQMLGTQNDGSRSRVVTTFAGALTLFFLSGYAAAQLKAGSTALSGMFGWPEAWGVLLGAVIVVAYCFSGGLRASIWTDAAQALVMLTALFVLLAYGVMEVGGLQVLLRKLNEADPRLARIVPEEIRFGVIPYALGFVCGGLGVIGQPHVLIRTMAVKSRAELRRARSIYFLWYIPFSMAAVAVGLYGRVLLPDLLSGVSTQDAAVAAEQTLPALASLLLPELWLGVLLAAVFAATMSTADSQLLSCSAALTQDIAPGMRSSYLASKAATLGVAAVAALVAIFADRGVFDLVLGAWSALGAALGPLLIIRLARLPITEKHAVALMTLGLVTELLWARMGLSEQTFELLPGLLVPVVVFGLLEAWQRVVSRKPSHTS